MLHTSSEVLLYYFFCTLHYFSKILLDSSRFFRVLQVSVTSVISAGFRLIYAFLSILDRFFQDSSQRSARGATNVHCALSNDDFLVLFFALFLSDDCLKVLYDFPWSLGSIEPLFKVLGFLAKLQDSKTKKFMVIFIFTCFFMHL